MVRRTKRTQLGVAGAALVLTALAGTALALASSPLSASGDVTGNLSAAETVVVRAHVAHDEGWQQISEVEVDLELRGKPLEQLVVDPTHDSVVLLGEAGPAALGQPATLAGPFFRVDPAAIGLTAKGQRLALTMPVTLQADPPVGARLTLQARGFDLSHAGPVPLSAPVQAANGGFSWGTVAAAAAAALFAGGFIGSLFASHRRPPPRPSIYATVQRRIEQERTER